MTLTVEACFPIDGTSAGVRVLASKHQPLVHMTPIKLSLVLEPPMLPPAPPLSEDAATSCSTGTRGSLARDRQFYKASSVCLQPFSFHSFQSPISFLPLVSTLCECPLCFLSYFQDPWKSGVCLHPSSVIAGQGRW